MNFGSGRGNRLRLFTLLLCFCLYPRPAAGAALAEAEAHLKAGRLAEAYRIYFDLLREEPEDDAVSLGLARTAMALGRYHQAVMAYERLIAKYPGETALYREIAEAYLALGDKDTAMAYLQNDRSLTADGIGVLAGKLGARHNRWQQYGNLRLGVNYDSNALQGPAATQFILNTQWGQFNLSLPDQRIDGGGLYLGGQWDWSWRTTPGGSWWAVGDASFYSAYKFNSDLKDLNSEYSQYWRVAAGMRRAGPRYMLDIRFKGDVFDYDFTQAVYSAGPEINYIRAVRPRLHLITSGGLDWRDYKRDRGHNGVYGYLGQYVRAFWGKRQHEFIAGLRYVRGRADAAANSYDGGEITAAWRFKLKGGWELSPSVAYAFDNYKAPANFLMNEDREDTRLRLGLSALYRINEWLSLESGYNFTRNHSNSPLHKYRRHTLNIGIIYSF